MQRSSHSAPVPASAATTAGGVAAQPRLFDEMRARMLRLGLSPRTSEKSVRGNAPANSEEPLAWRETTTVQEQFRGKRMPALSQAP